MLKKIALLCSVLISFSIYAQQKEILWYHAVKTDKEGKIIPWYNPDFGTAYDHIINIVWNFWDTMRHDMNGLPYYMNHQVWNPKFDDPRGIGGDQFAMALSSWRLYYAYSGNERVKANMNFIADYTLTHGLSASNTNWPYMPFTYNTYIYSGIYDGDMRDGIGVAQPDKSGSFAFELVHLYKITENPLYLNAAIEMANTLASHTKQGNINYSPLPFKVYVDNGQTALLRHHDFTNTWIDTAGYTTNWAPTLNLYLGLISLHAGDTIAYKKSFDIILNWMKEYAMKENKWGPFFEDVDWWSETQINAMTFARFIMEHREYFPDWKQDVMNIINWVHKNFSNDKYKKYGVTVTNEQTVYPVPGNSHSSRQAADELLYVSLTGDSSFYENAIRELNWVTYCVDFDGKNRFPEDEPWLTDGYGDFVRHFLRAMDAAPALTPPNQNHIISTSSVIQQADYAGSFKKFIYLNWGKIDSNKVQLFYRTFDSAGIEKIKLAKKPSAVLLEYKPINESLTGEGYEWKPMQGGGILIVRRENGKNILILK